MDKHRDRCSRLTYPPLVFETPRLFPLPALDCFACSKIFLRARNNPVVLKNSPEHAYHCLLLYYTGGRTGGGVDSSLEADSNIDLTPSGKGEFS